MSMERLEARLEKMEISLHKRFDELSRLDERHSETVRRVGGNEARLNKHAERLADLEMDTRDNTKVASAIERVFWIMVASVLSAVTYIFRDSI